MAVETEKYSLWGGIALTVTASMLLMARAEWWTFALFAVDIWLVTRALYRYMGCQAGDKRIIFSTYFVYFSRRGDVV